MNRTQTALVDRLWELMMTRRDVVFPSWEAGFVYSMKRKAIRHGWELTLKQELKLEELAMTYLGTEEVSEVYEADLGAAETRVVNAVMPENLGPLDPRVLARFEELYKRIESMVEHLDAWDKVVSGFGRDLGYEKDLKLMISAVTHLTEHDISMGMFDVSVVGRVITITFADDASTYFTPRNRTHIMKRIRSWAAVHFLVVFQQGRVA